ncbi:glycoside hydrolase family 76 protein [Paenibacillus sp. NPDC058174]|uniref:glycoside hydrolase family 76 protein n=1 Tax=Paenibacillus sp. NPDC058174 TaxID=3346366 RepID=UPI0036DEBC1F
MTKYAARADLAQQKLHELFWNPDINMYNIETPCPDGSCNTIFHYWWMAHAVDVLVDGYVRTGDNEYRTTLSNLYDGLLQRNGGAWPNELYDDMEWMALAWLRAYSATGEEKYRKAVHELWEDIKTGWNDNLGGGIAWRKSQLDYKNTPANAPAIILAMHLYKAFGDSEDLEWAKKIYAWQKNTLVDPENGFVWDGMNRTGDGMIDKHWEFTYCQGVFIGAAHELYQATGQQSYLDDAAATASITIKKLTDPQTHLLPDEGNGDGGLFKGIFVRYAAGLAADYPEQFSFVTEVLLQNAERMWNEGRDAENTLFGPAWNQTPGETVELGTQICGVTLLEMTAKLERAGLLGNLES